VRVTPLDQQSISMVRPILGEYVFNQLQKFCGRPNGCLTEFTSKKIEKMGTAVNFNLLASYWTIAGNVCPFALSEASPLDFHTRVETTANAGYHGIGLNNDDLVAVLARYGVEEAKAILANNGMQYLELEFITDWFAEGDRRRESDLVRRSLLDGAAQLGANHIKVGGDFSGATWPMDRMAEEFSRLCEDGAAVGAPIALEIMPWTNLRTIELAMQVVQGASHWNGGLLLDIWHFSRGGIDFSDISHIPSELIFYVEIDDAAAQQKGTLLEDTIHRRLLCGEGDLDVPDFLRHILAAGYTGPFGVEIISAAQRSRSLEQAAKQSQKAAAAQFAAFNV